MKFFRKVSRRSLFISPDTDTDTDTDTKTDANICNVYQLCLSITNFAGLAGPLSKFFKVRKGFFEYEWHFSNLEQMKQKLLCSGFFIFTQISFHTSAAIEREAMSDRSPSFREMGLCAGEKIKMQDVCEAVKSACYWNPTSCFTNKQLEKFWGASAPAPLTQEQLREEKRLLFRHLYEKFMEMKNTPRFLQTCCGSNLQCLKNFSQVRLKMTSDEQSFYNSVSNEIALSEKLFEDLSSHHNLDRVFLHEMGHACQFARANGLNYILLEFGLRPIPSEKRNFKRNFSEATWECLKKNYRGWQADQRVSAPKRLREAFANGIFASEMKSIFHWYSPCHVRSDASHADPVEYMDCFLQDDKLKEQLCS